MLLDGLPSTGTLCISFLMSRHKETADSRAVKQLTLRLPADYHRKLKILAACTGKSMTELLISCIDEKLESCLASELARVRPEEGG
jgi:hypothetical protein